MVLCMWVPWKRDLGLQQRPSWDESWWFRHQCCLSILHWLCLVWNWNPTVTSVMVLQGSQHPPFSSISASTLFLRICVWCSTHTNMETGKRCLIFSLLNAKIFLVITAVSIHSSGWMFNYPILFSDANLLIHFRSVTI